MKKTRYLTAALCAVVLLCGLTIPAYAGGGEEWSDVEVSTREPMQTTEPTPDPTPEPTPEPTVTPSPSPEPAATEKPAVTSSGTAKPAANTSSAKPAEVTPSTVSADDAPKEDMSIGPSSTT